MKTSSLPKRIVCFGDSKTDGDTYPKLIMQSLHEAGRPVPTCICSGVGGDTMEMMNARFDRTVSVFQPDLVTILGGVNDAFHNVAADDYIRSLRSIVAKVKSLGARLMLLTPGECMARSGNSPEEREPLIKRSRDISTPMKKRFAPWPRKTIASWRRIAGCLSMLSRRAKVFSSRTEYIPITSGSP